MNVNFILGHYLYHLFYPQNADNPIFGRYIGASLLFYCPKDTVIVIHVHSFLYYALIATYCVIQLVLENKASYQMRCFETVFMGHSS